MYSAKKSLRRGCFHSADKEEGECRQSEEVECNFRPLGKCLAPEKKGILKNHGSPHCRTAELAHLLSWEGARGIGEKKGIRTSSFQDGV